MVRKHLIFGALPHTGRAPIPKIFLFLICFLVFGCNSVFGSSLTIEDVNQILTGINGSETSVDSNAQNGILTNSANYEYAIVTKGTSDTQITIYWSNTKPEATLSSSYVQFQAFAGQSMEIFTDGEMRNNRTSNGVTFRLDSTSKYVFLADGATNNTGNGETYGAGWQNKDFVVLYKAPYFEFAGTKIGTTTLENISGNINCYYLSSFPTWVNSYTQGRTLGYLYIDKNYTINNLYSSSKEITKKNLTMTNSWFYEDNTLTTYEEVGAYKKYEINVQNSIITAPYFYNLVIKSINEELAIDINMNFVILSENSSGGIIVESGDTQLSGDFTKDETTLGDINNTINEPYNPNNNILNELTSGDILGNMGYEVTQDPNQDLWDTIINGLKETLTENGEQVFEFSLRYNSFRISSNDLYIPDGTIKTFLALFIDFWFLMQMFQFVKRTIDQINEGDLKVMHDVDADCYFF